MPMRNTMPSKGVDVQPYKYNGKELDLMHGLNTYEHAARQYNPVTARWDRIDPLAEKYYSTSPYAYCANNPVRFIDKDGRDYTVNMDSKNMTITISATYYALKEDVGVATATANVWNNASGQFCYVTEGGDHYTVNFDLNVVESPNLYPESGDKWGSLTLSDGFSNDKSGKANVFYTVNTLGQQELSNGDTGSVNGQTTNGNAIRVTNARATDSETSAHEMGHTLGMHHTSKGLMTEKSNMSSRNGRPTAKNVQESIHSAMKGKTNDAGKGTFITDKTYTKDELRNLQKGKVE